MPVQSKEFFEQSQITVPTEAVWLPPDEPVEIDTNTPLEELDDHSVLAHIKAGDHEFLVLDLQNSEVTQGSEKLYHPFGQDFLYEKRFLLIDKSFDPRDSSTKGYKDIGNNEEIKVGSTSLTTRFNYASDNQMSRQHFTLRSTGDKLFITDLNSMSRTRLFRAKTSNNPEGPDPDADARAHYERIRAQEAADLRARQEKQARENQERLRAKAHAAESKRASVIQPNQDPEEREQELKKLRGFVADVVNRYEKNYPDIRISAMGQLVASIHNSRLNDMPDKKIYMEFAKQFHPDRLQNMNEQDRQRAETAFKLINDMYDPGTKSFRF